MREWYPFPIHAFQREGTYHIVPTDRDVQSLISAKNRTAETMADLPPEDPENLKEGFVKLLESYEAQIEKVKKEIATLRDRAEIVFKFELSEPTFGEFLDAEERSKDFINGEPRVDEGKLSVYLMSNRVRRDGKELSGEEIKSLPFVVARKLWEEVKARVYPDPARISFLEDRPS